MRRAQRASRARAATVLASIALAGAAAVFARPAHAQTISGGGDDVVLLQNGGRLRGAVLVHEPGVRTVVRLADGSTRTVPGAEVREVVRAPAPAGAPQPPAPAARPAVAADAWPALHVDAPVPVRIVRFVPTGMLASASLDYCVAPCDRGVPRGVALTAEHESMPAASFVVPPGLSGVRVVPGRNNTLGVLNAFGIVVLAVGVTATLIGVPVLIVGIAVQGAAPIALGAGLTVVGVGAMVGGVYMFRASNFAATRVEDEQGRRLARAVPVVTVAF